MDWTEGLERALLVGLLHGRLGLRRGALPSDVFTDVRRQLCQSAEEYHQNYGRWPAVSGLYDLARTLGTEMGAARAEVRALQSVNEDQIRYAIDSARPIIKRRALKLAALELDAMADQDPSGYARAREIVDAALSSGEAETPPYSFAGELQARHRPDAVQRSGGIVCPTGVPTLDKAMDGGLKSGEVGFIMAPTKTGKSHWGVLFGAEWLRRGGHVLHLTLELRPDVVAKRYDRNLTGMDDWEIRDNPALFERRWKETLPFPERLAIRGFPRFSIGASTVEALIKEHLNSIGEACLVVLDYGQILKPEVDGAPHVQIGRTHEALSTMAMTLKVPLWTPYQANRQALGKEAKGRVGLEHAGGSYEALQHGDVVLTLSQDEEDEMHRRMRAELAATRDSREAFAMVQYDWARSSVKELK